MSICLSFNNARFREYYQAGVDIHNQILPMSTFCDLQFCINGTVFPSVNEISQATTTILDTAILSSFPTVFGLGDTHGTNIIIGDTVQPNSSRDLLYIDYEVAGYHSALLGLAKPFHHDVFFEMLYADKIEDFLDIQYSLVDDNILVVDLRTSTDELSQAILDIKRRYSFTKSKKVGATSNDQFKYSRSKR